MTAKKPLLIFFILAMLFSSHAKALTLSVSPVEEVNGELYILKGREINIIITGEKNEQVPLSVASKFDIEAKDGSYAYQLEDFPIPIEVERIVVNAYNVNSMKISVCCVLFFSKEFIGTVRNGKATVSIDMTKYPVSSKGMWDIRISGETTASKVTVEAEISATIQLDSSGRYELTYDTSKLPEGDFIVKAGSNKIIAHVVSDPSQIPTPTQTPTPVVTPVTPTPVKTPVPAKTPIPTPTPIKTPKPTPVVNTTNTEKNSTTSPNKSETFITTPVKTHNQEEGDRDRPSLVIPGFTSLTLIVSLAALIALLRKL